MENLSSLTDPSSFSRKAKDATTGILEEESLF